MDYTHTVLAQLEDFLARLLPSVDFSIDGETKRKVYEALSINQEIAKMGLNHLNNMQRGKKHDEKFPQLATAISYFSTLLIQANLTVLQMAWHKIKERKAIILNMSGGNTVSELVTKASQYIIADKKFIQTHSKIKDVIEETFAVNGLSKQFSRWPVLYICVIWLSKLFNEENGGNSSIRFISGLSDSLVMSDWFNTGTSDVDDDDSDNSSKPFWIWLALVFNAAKETFDMRMHLFDDAATAVRGIIQGVHFETKNKIEHAFQTDAKLLVDAMVESKLDKLPSFQSWLTMCIFDIGLTGILGCDGVNSLTRIREASFTFLLFNDIVDIKRDWACGEIRNFLIIQCTKHRNMSQASDSFGLCNKTIAVSIGAYEFIVKNEAIYGIANIMAQHCVYPWQIASGRYGMIKTYLLNVGNYLQEQKEHEEKMSKQSHLDCDESIPEILKYKPPIRIVDAKYLRGFTHRFDDDFQPIINVDEAAALKYISVDQLLTKCYLYMGMSAEQNLSCVAFATGNLSTKFELELRRAELIHEECKYLLISSLDELLSQEHAVTVIGLTTAISSLTSYFNLQLDTKSPVLDYAKQPITLERIVEISTEIHLKFAMILEIFTTAYCRKTPPCKSCCDKLGDWIDETCCETALKFEKVLENFVYTDRMNFIKIILGSVNFSANYMKVPFYELHLRSNLMAVVHQQVKDGLKINSDNSGDKFTF